MDSPGNETRRSANMPDTVHEYSWVASHVSLLVAAGWTILAVAPFAHLGRVPPMSGALLGYWLIWLGLVLVAFWGQRNSNRRLRRVAVYPDGLWFDRPSQKGAVFVAWAQIERAETFSSPDPDALYILGQGGVRLCIGEHRFLIYEHIRSFAQLSDAIRSKVPRECWGAPPSKPCS